MPPAPLVPAPPEMEAMASKVMPSSNFQARYDDLGVPSTFKVEDDQGRFRVVANFKQGFTGRAVERYPDGATYVGDYHGGRRHGRGQFMDTQEDTLMVSYFSKGKPAGEGTKCAP